MPSNSLVDDPSAIAVVGMACSFPGADSVDEYWSNLRDGVESIQRFSDDELAEAGVDSEMIDHPDFVPAAARLERGSWFDASFFGYPPREAMLMDPQHRRFLECVWQGLEHAGYQPDAIDDPVGVFAGAGMNRHIQDLYEHGLMQKSGMLQVRIANDKDFLSTRASFKLDLDGPSLNINTACSTSLVATHVACQSLLDFECDVAIAGGSTVTGERGYLYQDGSIFSPNGTCRPFDADAEGTVIGEGVGVVVLKRLDDAIEDGDSVHAVIRGSAVNNDGAQKVGFTAPNPDAQARVITAALAVAGVDPDTISYVEAHGTGTTLGDPIEIAGLRKAFERNTDRKQYCAIGSVKSNVGHLDAAAGVAGLIKTVLALKHRTLPPSLNYQRPNPNIDFADSPFFVNDQCRDWTVSDSRRRAGVSSLGVGGTNAHVILEEAPELPTGASSGPSQILCLSAKTPAALGDSTEALKRFLETREEVPMADLAFTLQTGRKPFAYRRLVVGDGAADVAQALDDPQRSMSGRVTATSARRIDADSADDSNSERPASDPEAPTLNRPPGGVVFMFPGGGAQYPNMGRGLYEHEAVYREAMDTCFDLFRRHSPRGLAETDQDEDAPDLSSVLYPTPDDEDRAAELLRRPRWGLPALFATEYALAQTWMQWGIQPEALIGHSLGEYVAATLSGVHDLADAISLVALRGRLFETLSAGGMLSVPLPAEDVKEYLGEDTWISVVNAPEACVVSGSDAGLDDLAARLRGAEILPPEGTVRRLNIDVAAHSPMVDPILDDFAEQATSLTPQPPSIPYVSNRTGDWADADLVQDSTYWVEHLRQPVLFSDGVEQLLEDTSGLLLEVGPGRMLNTLVRMQGVRTVDTMASLRHPQEQTHDLTHVQTTLGRLWLRGVDVDWAGHHANENRRRTEGPTYRFDRQCFEIGEAGGDGVPAQPKTGDDPSARSAEMKSFQQQRPPLPTEYVEPSSAVEETVAEVWEDVIGFASIGIHDNFFDLGGSSLLATQILARLNETFPVTLSIREVLETPTVAGVADVVEDRLIEKVDSMSEEEVQRLL
jgi:acyl transferase domain-containing protein